MLATLIDDDFFPVIITTYILQSLRLRGNRVQNVQNFMFLIGHEKRRVLLNCPFVYPLFPNQRCFINSIILHNMVPLTRITQAERERGHWVIYYTSPQSFIITFSYSFAEQHSKFQLILIGRFINVSTTNFNVYKG